MSSAPFSILFLFAMKVSGQTSIHNTTTVVSWVSAHGRLNITHDISAHMSTYLGYTFNPLNVVHLYMGAYPGVDACPGYYGMCIIGQTH